MVVTLGQLYDIGEKPTVMLYTYINRHAGTPDKNKNMVVCVFFPFILDIKFVGRTSCHTGFFIHLLSAVRALIFLARRIQPFLSLVDREVEFCVLTI